MRLVGTAVGCINYKGQFAALIYNLKFSDGSSLSVSMGEMVCAQLASLFQGYLVEVGGVSESPEAEREFKRNEGVMPMSSTLEIIHKYHIISAQISAWEKPF